MCLILLANDYHPRYKLVVAANRDEFYKRPTLPANFWSDYPSILAGKDLEQGGTWMGITTEGRFAALTNYRALLQEKPNAPSRGHLVYNYLSGDQSAVDFLHGLNEKSIAYNGFNLLAGTAEALYYYSNQERLIRRVEKGVHGLSNSLLDVSWPKVRKGVKALAGCLQELNIRVERLFEILADQEIFNDSELPNTGISIEKERMLSPLYIVSPEYGTRSSTILLINQHNQVQFWERSFVADGSRKVNDVYYEFRINAF